MDQSIAQRVLAQMDQEKLLALQQACIRIPSPTGEEGALADYLFDRLHELGMELDMHEVVDASTGHRTRQPVACWRGAGEGPSLMFNGHMDHNPVVGQWDFDPFCGDFRDGWVLGRGAQDEKGGIVATLHALEMLKRARVRLQGDVWVTPVALHKLGGVGTQTLIDRGIRADYAINTENSGLGVATVLVGAVKWRATARAKPVHFHSPQRTKGPHYLQPVAQLMILLEALGPSYTPIPLGRWCTYKPDPRLPDYPQLAIETMHSAHLDGTCTMVVQTQLVQGQGARTLRSDLEALLGRLKEEQPGVNISFEVPYPGGLSVPPYGTPHNSPLVRSLTEAHRQVTGEEPEVGARPRIGTTSDGNNLGAAGVHTVVYGPGSIQIFDQYPTPNERIWFKDIVVAAKVYALTCLMLCGVADP